MKNEKKAKTKNVCAELALTCPKCGKPAFRREERAGQVAYLHFKKKGSARCLLARPS